MHCGSVQRLPQLPLDQCVFVVLLQLQAALKLLPSPICSTRQAWLGPRSACAHPLQTRGSTIRLQARSGTQYIRSSTGKGTASALVGRTHPTAKDCVYTLV